ncbi:MAG: DNA polymerase III subunit beta [Acidimicrobiales bacterium]
MKFRCERDVLLEALSTAGRAVGGRAGNVALSGLHLELDGDVLRVTGSDLDLTITQELTVGGDTDGVVVIPSKLIADIVRALGPGAVDVVVEGDEAQITAGRSEFAIRTIPADDFPRLGAPAANEVTLSAADLSDSLKQVVKAASGDDSRPILTGVLLAAEGDDLRLVSTDSYRLAVRDLPGSSVLDSDQSVLVPSRALSELTRVLGENEKVAVRLGERDASFSVGGTEVVTRLIEGEFPNYRGLIPDSYPNKLTVNRAELLDAVRRVRLMAQEATPIRLNMSSDGLELVAVTQDVGQAQEALDASYDGEDLTVAFNPDYLIDGIEVTSGEEVTLQTVDPLKPAVMRDSTSDDFLYLLMPVRVS